MRAETSTESTSRSTARSTTASTGDRIGATVRTYSRGCSRPGCNGEPIVTMSYDQANAAVFVGQLTPAREPSMYDLCRRHLDVLSAPRGWVIRREPLSMAGETDETWHSPASRRSRNVV